MEAHLRELFTRGYDELFAAWIADRRDLTFQEYAGEWRARSEADLLSRLERMEDGALDGPLEVAGRSVNLHSLVGLNDMLKQTYEGVFPREAG
jgi:hypothetical protein